VNIKLAQVSVEIVVTGAYFGTPPPTHTHRVTHACARLFILFLF